jgi:serine/threonine-protein kinase
MYPLPDVSLARVGGGNASAQLAVVKRLKLGADADPDLLEQFADEARVSLRLKHPNIVQALAAGEDPEGPFLVFEYLEGQTLGRIRARASRHAGGIPRPIALHIVMAIATGLAYAHTAQDEAGRPLRIVHRDVSPDNIIVTYAGETKLIDFSVATAKIAAIKGRAGATKGNIAYMAPEQGQSAFSLDERADVFAAGLVLWELLAGKRMWEGVSDADVLARLADDKPLASLRSVVPDIPEALDAICTQALTKVRDERLESAVELREAIEKATKTLGLETTTSEVAAFVTSLFEDEREKTQAMISEALASPIDAAQSLPRLPAPQGLPDVESQSKLSVGAPLPIAAPIQVVEVQVEKPSGDRRFVLALVGAVLIAFALVAVVAITHKDKGGDQNASLAPTPRPVATVAFDAAADYVEPEEVAVDISVIPRTAQLTIDGVKAPSSTYHTKVVRGKFVHEVRAEAQGYEPRTLKVTFDRDRTLEIALTPKPVVPVHRRPPPPRTASSAPPPPSAESTSPSPPSSSSEAP